MPTGIQGSLLGARVLIYSPNHIYEPENTLLLAILFTVLFVSVLVSKTHRERFGKESAIPLWKIIGVHSVFLAILAGFIWLASRLAPSLPNWMTETSRPMSRPDSVSDFLFFACALGLHGLERFWLCAQYLKLKPSTLEDALLAEERKRRGPRK